MKRAIFPLAVMAGLAFASPATAATELFPNGNLESSGTTGRDDFCGTAISPGPMGWSTSCWSTTAAGLDAYSFKYVTEGTNHAIQVTASSSYVDGDAKWT